MVSDPQLSSLLSHESSDDYFKLLQAISKRGLASTEDGMESGLESMLVDYLRLKHFGKDANFDSFRTMNRENDNAARAESSLREEGGRRDPPVFKSSLYDSTFLNALDVFCGILSFELVAKPDAYIIMRTALATLVESWESVYAKFAFAAAAEMRKKYLPRSKQLILALENIETVALLKDVSIAGRIESPHASAGSAGAAAGGAGTAAGGDAALASDDEAVIDGSIPAVLRSLPFVITRSVIAKETILQLKLPNQSWEEFKDLFTLFRSDPEVLYSGYPSLLYLSEKTHSLCPSEGSSGSVVALVEFVVFFAES